MLLTQEGGTRYSEDRISNDRYSNTRLLVYTERVKELGLGVRHDVPPQTAQRPCDLSEEWSLEQRSSSLDLEIVNKQLCANTGVS